MSSNSQSNKMSHTELAINVSNLGKVYQIYDRPEDRLKFSIISRLRGLAGLQSKSYYRKFWALRNVSLKVKKGETFGIIGCNGSGKSTLLQIVCGTLPPTHGKVDISGRVAALLELGSGFNPEFTGRENVYLYASILGLTKEEINARYNDILLFADIGSFIDQPVKTYSSGMVVRLAFAVVAHVDADILVIDEALSVGDVFFTQKCMRFLRDFKKTKTLIFVSHDTGAVLNLCDKAILLKDGAIKFQGNSKEVVEKYLQKDQSEIKDSNSNYQKNNRKKVDMRLKFINQTSLRNDIELFYCALKADSFGLGGATIKNVEFLTFDDNLLTWIVGGETVKLEIHCLIKDELLSPIIGFQVKDRLGQVIFGDNTFLSYINNPVSAYSNQNLTASFEFIMPILPMGNYTVSVAIAEGTQKEHVQHHWLNDVIAFKSHSSSVCTGLVGLVNVNISMIADN
jgi:lipopolysaccharide transport system ATP-binding protein